MGNARAARNSSRTHLRRFLTSAAEVMEPGQLVLDAGSGRAPYRDLFPHVRYETADFLALPNKRYGEQDYVCDLVDIPVEDSRFDHVLLTQVLEHLPEPTQVLRELYRVLKPGGTLWLTAPLFYIEHEKPYDYYRYTRFGVRHVLQSAGFQVQAIEWMEGYLGTLSYQARVMSHSLPSSPDAYGGGAKGIALALTARASKSAGRHVAEGLAVLDLKYKIVGKGLPKNYQVIARKERGETAESPS